ncbi:hypothetical protein NDU88_003767 [Pleurodeles waltl]|uniref:Uncharacterized protein n=1 Tax=Pleurodeles waltl TaxID=8319 RepID=A0AAV7WTM8_PLEWA|nr:hypothetical protein NDU88_003767 [Pleurodeles waltl]
MDPKVQEALALLRQAGRLDLLKEEALAPGRPARRASAGVAVSVVACSPPRPAHGAQVGGSRGKAVHGAGPGASGVFRGWARGCGPARGSGPEPRAARGQEGCPAQPCIEEIWASARCRGKDRG